MEPAQRKPITPFLTDSTPTSFKNVSHREPSENEKKFLQVEHRTEKAWKVTKFIFPVKGYQALTISHHGDPIGAQLAPIVGTGMILFSPLLSISNVIAGLITAGGKIYININESANEEEKRKNIEAYREIQFQIFIESMCMRIEEMSNEQQMEFRQDPASMIASEAIEIAFLSRVTGGEYLWIGTNCHRESDFEDPVVKEFFHLMVKMRECFTDINYQGTIDEAWRAFMADVQGKNQNPNDFHSQKINEMFLFAHQFAEKAVENPLFQQLWKKKYP